MAVLMHTGLVHGFSDAQGSRWNGRARPNVTGTGASSSGTAGTTAAATVNGMHSQQQQSRQHQQDQEPEAEAGEAFQPFFCRALYDYASQDNSALSFRRGDIIEVLTQQPSGWWDGLLGDERGWFPSNYVVIISEEEAEQVFAAAASEVADQGAGLVLPAGLGNINAHENGTLDGGTEITPTASGQLGRPPTQQQPQHSRGTETDVDLSHALLRGGLVPSEGQQWISGEGEKIKPVNSHAESNVSVSSQPSDFWMPQVTPDGQIYYLNTHTGQQSRDLPSEVEDPAKSELSGFTPRPSSRSDTGSTQYRHQHSNSAASDPTTLAAFDFFNRSITPEPWIRRLADDGFSYYYLNKLDGSVQWTRPETTGPVTRGRSEPGSKPIPVPLAQNSSSRTLINKFEGTSRLSVYSDDSDVQPVEPRPRKLRSNGAIGTKEASDGLAFDQTSAERIAKSLQQALAPPPPELVTDLSAAAKFAIQAVVKNIQPNDLTRRSEDDQRMDDLINSVARAVRDLLYVSAVPTGQIPSSVLPPGYKDYKLSSQSSLKPVQRKVTATLSRLVLSARAMQYDSGITVNDTMSRIQSDAEELEKALSTFVLEVQRTQHAVDGRPLRRLMGAFSTADLGLGLIGAGAAGAWKGFGWVPLANEHDLPKRLLTPDVTVELASLVSRLDEKTTSFSYTLRVDESSADQLYVRGQDLITELSLILNFVADIHVARHVDVDGVLMDGTFSSNGIYANTVEKARSLVRTLEASMQAAHDDGMVLLMTTQSISTDEFGQHRNDKDAIYERLDTLCLSLKANMDLIQQTLEALLAIGHEQADTAQGEYNGSIEWRMSKLSMIRQYDDPGLTDEDVVDMEYAMNRRNKGLLPLGLSNQADEQEDEDPFIPPDEEKESITEVDAGPESSASAGADAVGKSPPRQNAANPKLTRIFGDEYADKLAKDSQPWYLQANYDPNEILVDPDGTIRGGTLGALVERLTSHDQMDPSYSKAFLMTFKSFTTVDELFDLLVARFRMQPPANLTPEEKPEWQNLKQRVIQIRVLNAFKAMITDEDVLDKEDDSGVLDRVLEFLKSDEVSHLNAATTLVKNIERIKAGDLVRQTQTNPGVPPPPMVPKTTKKLKLLDIDALELARQLTIKESELYRKIKPIECLLRAREQKSENLDNIATVIQTSNRIADWVAESILSKDDYRKRGSIVKHLITVADRCRTLNNFSTMIAITSGLNTPPIRRLKRTWEQVNRGVMAQFAACEATIDSKNHFKEYRRMMQTVNPPCVPFIGVFLTDLQFIHDGNPDNLPGGLINFRKRLMLSEVIGNIKRWQGQPFNLASVPVVSNYVEESLNQFIDTKASSDRFWEMSMEREPREREDEKMARLLQESGFL